MLKNQQGKFLAPLRRLSSPRRRGALRRWSGVLPAAWPALLAGLALAACQPRPAICPPGAPPPPSAHPARRARRPPRPRSRRRLRPRRRSPTAWSCARAPSPTCRDGARTPLPRRCPRCAGAASPGRRDRPRRRWAAAECAGTVAAWLPLCAGVAAVPPGDSAALRALLEREARPVAVTNRGEARGLFTGYYEPTLRGSRTRGGAFLVPLYLRPRAGAGRARATSATTSPASASPARSATASWCRTTTAARSKRARSPGA